MIEVLNWLNTLVWGIPTLFLIVIVGIYLTYRTKGVQLRLFPAAIYGFWRQFKRKKSKNSTSSYRALCTALAATVGTGNIAGVAGAIAIGGPGAIFWMWVCALLGMVTKFAEATLAVRYRHKDGKNELLGGPMYMIEKGLPCKYKWLAYIYCFFGIVASLGVGNATQVDAVVCSLNSVIAFGGGETGKGVDFLVGLIIAAVLLTTLLGGAKRIGTIAEKLVPLVAAGYLLLCIIVLMLCRPALPDAFRSIIRGAFEPASVTGGVVGSLFVSLRVGASRGVFTNEAGMGTAAIAHCASDVDHPVEQGLMGIMEVFLDTILICTMTALVILCSGVDIQYGIDTGVLLTTAAFGAVLGDWICVPIAIAMCCFAIATILGWGLYGIRCTQYLFGENAWRNYVYLQGAVAGVCTLLGTGVVWVFAEIVNGLMAIPNLLALAYLTPELQRLLDEFSKKRYKLTQTE